MSTFREELAKLIGKEVKLFVSGYVPVTILSVHDDWVEVDTELEKRREKLQISHIVSFIVPEENSGVSH